METPLGSFLGALALVLFLADTGYKYLNFFFYAFAFVPQIILALYKL